VSAKVDALRRAVERLEAGQVEAARTRAREQGDPYVLILDALPKLLDIAEACDLREYEQEQGACIVCEEQLTVCNEAMDCPGYDIRTTLDALEAP
jgi:hypothetical protein